jgi:hypothetical protein
MSAYSPSPNDQHVFAAPPHELVHPNIWRMMGQLLASIASSTYIGSLGRSHRHEYPTKAATRVLEPCTPYPPGQNKHRLLVRQSDHKGKG